MARNKKRIYMALYARFGTNGHVHHVALLVSPKCPDASSENTWRLHAMNRPNVSYASQQEWHYEAKMVIGRTLRLIALVLLGKTERTGEDISHLLIKVALIQDDPNWTCKEWVFSAIEFLITQEVIVRPAVSLDNLYDSASKLANSFKETLADEPSNRSVPTCDNSGAEIASEVR